MFKKVIFVFILAALFTGAGCIQFGGSTAAGPVGMYRSADKGDTWQQIVALPTATGVQSLSGLKIYRIFSDPGDVNAWYIGTRGQGMYYTYDNGNTWQVASALNGKFIYSVAVDPTDKCTVYANDGTNIYKTEDCSRNWKTVFHEERTDQRLVGLTIHPKDGKKLYAALVGGDVISSLDAGKSWQKIKHFDVELQAIEISPIFDKVTSTPRIYVASYRDGLFRSDNAGKDWVSLKEGLEGFSQSNVFYRLVMNPNKKDSLFWVSKYGILRSDDAGKTWEEIKLLTSPGSVSIFGFAINPKNDKEMYYTGTILSDKNENVRSTFYRTVDGGVNWITKKLPTNTIPAIMAVHKEKTGVLFLGFTILD